MHITAHKSRANLRPVLPIIPVALNDCSASYSCNKQYSILGVLTFEPIQSCKGERISQCLFSFALANYFHLFILFCYFFFAEECLTLLQKLIAAVAGDMLLQIQ